MIEAPRLRGIGGFFFLSHHPWAGVVVIGIVALLAYYQNHRRR